MEKTPQIKATSKMKRFLNIKQSNNEYREVGEMHPPPKKYSKMHGNKIRIGKCFDVVD